MLKRIILNKLIIVYIASFILQITFVFANPLDNWQNPKSYKPRPVLFLHGLGRGNPDNWDPAKTSLGKYFSKYEALGSYLEAIDFQDPNGSVDTYDPGKTNPQGNSKGWADKVQDKVNELLVSNKYGAYTNKLNFVCHSMGGLAARWYLANYFSNFVDKLILIGVPNNGSQLTEGANALSKIPKLGWLTLIPVNSVEAFVRDNLDLWISGYLKIDINGEAIDDLDNSPGGSGFLTKLNNIQQSPDINYFGIIGIRWGLPNWVLFKNWYGGDWVVDKNSQLGTGVILVKDSTTISAVHWREPEIAAKETDNKILSFLDSTPPELEITSPDPSQTTEIYENSIHIKGEIYKEYLPADSELTINVERQEGGYTAPPQTSLLKPSDLWIPNVPELPVAEFDELINFPGSGTYEISCQVKNPAGLTSDIKDILVKVTVLENAQIIVHCHNPEGKEIASIQGMSGHSVEIYDGDNFIGYSAHDAASHNQAIIINAGSHTIKVKFNGITLQQNITSSPGETQVLVFTFTRTVWDFKAYLNSIGTVSRSRSGSLSHPPSPADSWNFFNLDTDTGYPRIGAGLAIHIWGHEQNTESVSTTGHVEMTISSSSISHRVWADTSASYSGNPPPPYTVGIFANYTKWDYDVPRYKDLISVLHTNAFNNWFLQNKAVPGLSLPPYRCFFYLDVWEIVDRTNYSLSRIGTGQTREATIFSYSSCFYADWYGTYIYQDSVPSNFYLNEVYCSSIPYDLDGHAV